MCPLYRGFLGALQLIVRRGSSAAAACILSTRCISVDNVCCCRSASKSVFSAVAAWRMGTAQLMFLWFPIPLVDLLENMGLSLLESRALLIWICIQ